MTYILKGFFLGIFFLIAFTLILSSMTSSVFQDNFGKPCDYSCSIQKLTIAYQSPWFIVLFAAFWVLGSKTARLSYLINQQKRGINNIKLKKEFRFPWEHKLSVIEDKD